MLPRVDPDVCTIRVPGILLFVRRQRLLVIMLICMLFGAGYKCHDGIEGEKRKGAAFSAICTIVIN